MNGLYTRVTPDATPPRYELMHNGEKLSDIPFDELADFCVYMIDMLSEKRDRYTVVVGGRELSLSWRELHTAVTQCTAAIGAG